jgi:hypothetical protein
MYGFQTAQEIYCAFLTIFFVSYFLTCGHFTMFYRDPIKFDPLEEEEADALVEMEKKKSMKAIAEEAEIEDQQD